MKFGLRAFVIASLALILLLSGCPTPAQGPFCGDNVCEQSEKNTCKIDCGAPSPGGGAVGGGGQPTPAPQAQTADTETGRAIAKQGTGQAQNVIKQTSTLPQIPSSPKFGVGQITDLFMTIKGTKDSPYDGKLFAIKLASIDKNPQGELQLAMELYEYASNTNQIITPYVTKATIPATAQFIDSYFKDPKTGDPIISDKMDGDDKFNYLVTKQIGLVKVDEAKKEVELVGEMFRNLPSPEETQNEIQNRMKAYNGLRDAGKLKSYTLRAGQTTDESAGVLGSEKLLLKYGSQKLKIKLVSTAIPGAINEVNLVGQRTVYFREKHTKVEIYVASLIPEKKDVLLYTYEPMPESGEYFDVDLKNNDMITTKNHVYITLLRKGANTDTTNEVIVEVESSAPFEGTGPSLAESKTIELNPTQNTGPIIRGAGRYEGQMFSIRVAGTSVLTDRKVADFELHSYQGGKYTLVGQANVTFTTGAESLNNVFTNRFKDKVSALVNPRGSVTITIEATNPCNATGSPAWFRYYAENTEDVEISTEGSTIDTVLAVYTGKLSEPSSLKLVGCNDDAAADQTYSKLTIKTEKGTDYWITIDGKNGVKGTENSSKIKYSVEKVLKSLPPGTVITGLSIDAPVTDVTADALPKTIINLVTYTYYNDYTFGPDGKRIPIKRIPTNLEFTVKQETETDTIKCTGTKAGIIDCQTSEKPITKPTTVRFSVGVWRTDRASRPEVYNPVSVTILPKKAKATFTFDTGMTSTEKTLTATAYGNADAVSAGGGKTSAAEFLQKGGKKDYLVISDPASKGDMNYTVLLWVKPESAANQSIFAKTADEPTKTLTEQLRINNGVFEHYTYDGAGKTVTGTTKIKAGEWYFVAITAANNTLGGSGLMRLYVNGVQEGIPLDIKTLWDQGDRYYVGSNSAYNFGYFKGYIDNLTIYQAELEKEEIRAIYENTKASYK